jgi:hypothetical protein
MKIDGIKDIKKIFKKTAKRKRVELIHPLRDWSIGLAIAVFGFFGGVTAIAIDFYFQLVSPITPEVEEKPLVYKEEEVVRYASQYNERAQIFNEHRSTQIYIPIVEEVATTTEEDSEKETLAEEDIDE